MLPGFNLTNPFHKKLFAWAKMISLAGLTQVLVQLIGFACGILVIRLLPSKEYALYTIANTMLGTMTVLADGGIATGVMYQGGKVWKDKKKLGGVLATGLDLRQKFSVFSLMLAVPSMIYLLRHHNASWTMCILLSVSLIPTFLSALSGSLLQIAPKLHQDILPLQKNQVYVNILRLVLLFTTLFAFPWAFVAVLATGLPQIWSNLNIRKISAGYADYKQSPDLEVRKNILITVKKILPVSIYYCLSGQLTIWLISFFGSTKALAHIGALSRLTTILSVISILFTTLIVPRFARLPANKKIVVSKFFQLQALLILLSMVILFVFGFFSKNILWILGQDFSGLDTEVFLIAAGACASLISQSTNQLLSARGIIIPPAIFIFFAILIQVSLAFVVKINEVKGVLFYSIFTSLAIYFMRLTYILITIVKKKE